MKATLCLMLIFVNLSVSAQTKQKPGEAEPPLVSDSFLTGETWPAELLATDVDQYVTNRMEGHRRFIDHVFANLDQYKKQNPDLSEEQREQESSYFFVNGPEYPRRVDLAVAISQLSTMYFREDNTPYGYKSRLLGVGFPIDQLVHLTLPSNETLPEWLNEANQQAASVLAKPFDQSTDEQIRSYIQNLNKLEWTVKTQWLITFLERFSPESRTILVRFVDEYVAPETNANYRSPQATPYMIKSFRIRASYAHKKYCWPTPKDVDTDLSEIYSKNGNYLEWISVEKFTEYLYGNKTCPNQILATEIDLLRKNMDSTIERGRRMNLSKGCDLTSNLISHYKPKSMEELAQKSAVVFVGRVRKITPGFYRNQTYLANSLLTIEISTWLRKPDGDPGDTYHVMNGYAIFSLGPYQVCSEEGRYQNIPVNSQVLVFSEFPPLGDSGTLLSVEPDQLLLLDTSSQSTQKWGAVESMKLSTIKSILVNNTYDKNDSSEVYQ